MKTRGPVPILIASLITFSGVVACCAPWALVGYTTKRLADSTDLFSLGFGPSSAYADLNVWGGEPPLSAELVREGFELQSVEDRRRWVVDFKLDLTPADVVAPIAIELLAGLRVEDVPPPAYVSSLIRQASREPSPAGNAAVIRFAREAASQKADTYFEMTGLEYAVGLLGKAEGIRIVLEYQQASKKPFRSLLYGVREAASKGYLEDEARVLVLDMVARRHLTTSSAEAADAVAEGASLLWLELDPEAAVQRLVKPPFWRADFPNLLPILDSMTASKAVVPAASLRELGREMWKTSPESMTPTRHVSYRPRVIGAVVSLLAYQGEADAITLIEAMEREQAEGFASAALNARAALLRIRNPVQFARQRVAEFPNLEDVPAPLGIVLAADDFFALACDWDGMTEYFGSAEADQWEVHVGALRTLGLASHADDLERAAALLGRGGPAKTPRERMDQLERLGEREAALMEAIAERFYELEVDAIIRRYAIGHPELFDERRAAANSSDSQ